MLTKSLRFEVVGEGRQFQKFDKAPRVEKKMGLVHCRKFVVDTEKKSTRVDGKEEVDLGSYEKCSYNDESKQSKVLSAILGMIQSCGDIGEMN